jgi:hypothetical protein
MKNLTKKILKQPDIVIAFIFGGIIGSVISVILF